MYPALMGALSVFIIFWVADEIFRDKKAGLFAAVCLATVPAYIARTSAGFFDKEATGGTFMLLAIFLFLRSYNKGSLKLGLLSAFSVSLAMGSWGGAQFIVYIIASFIVIKLLLNQYSERILRSSVLPLAAVFLTQHFFLRNSSFTFEQIISLLIIGLVLVRYAAGKYRLVKDEQLPYLIPGLLVLILISVLVGSMFSDYLWGIVNRVISLVYLPAKSVIGTTVAEQMPGTWNDITSRTSITFSRSMLPLGPPFDSLFSIWFLFIAGTLAIVYNIYSKRNWLLLFPLIWLLMAIQTVLYMVRLVFFLGPPTSIVAGYVMAVGINKLSGLDYMKKRNGLHKINAVSLIVIAIVSLIIIANLATGYVFCSSVGPSYNQYWDEAMNYMKTQTPVNSSILSWWDFGYWFQTMGDRPSTADGGNINGTVNVQIAQWFVSDAANWTQFRPWLRSKNVSYILMDYTLPGKYGAISKIASGGKTITGMLQFQQSNRYPQQNKTIIEYRAGQYTVWIPVGSSGQLAGAPIFMISKGEQYLGRRYVPDLCTTNGIITMPAPLDADTMPGCIAIAAYAIFYIPPEAEFSDFTDLMFMDGYSIPDIKKVFDNKLIRIYKLQINETVS